MKLPSIMNLRRQGWKVRVLHTREYNERLSNTFKAAKIVSNKGGYTCIELTPPEQPFLTLKGEAFCSKQDNFNRRLGNFIALGRAWHKFLNLNYD